LIAKKYLKDGRFFVDLIASLPMGAIAEAMDAKVSKGTLKLFRLVKITRLLRLARIITFIRMKKSFK
jgi:hypothetical protein